MISSLPINTVATDFAAFATFARQKIQTLITQIVRPTSCRAMVIASRRDW
jgi:hypothetical protein